MEQTALNRPGGRLAVRALKMPYAFHDGVVRYPRLREFDGEHKYFVKSIAWEAVSDAMSLSYERNDVDFILEQPEAQVLMDDLWACGVRPTEGAGSAGQSAAQQSHIKDLEQVTTKLLGIVEEYSHG